MVDEESLGARKHMEPAKGKWERAGINKASGVIVTPVMLGKLEKAT